MKTATDTTPTKEFTKDHTSNWQHTVCVGIDPSLTNTGICILDGETGALLRLGESKHALKDWHRLPAEDRNSAMGQLSRLAMIKDYVEDILIAQLVDYDLSATRVHICYEDYSFDSQNRAFSLGELGGVLKASIITLPVRTLHFSLVAPTAVKQFAVGQGNCTDKHPLMAQAVMECPSLMEMAEGILSSDLCDAYFLAKMAWYKGFPEWAVANEENKDIFRLRLEVANKLN